jgi:hypothetical protein
MADGSLPDTDRAAAVFGMAGEDYFSFGNSAGTDAQNADNEEMDAEKIPAHIAENINDILNGTPERKKQLEKHIFFIADTPPVMKKYGLTGDYFSIRYGAITRHRVKDADHYLTAENWKDLADAIKRPFAIAKHKYGYRIFTDVKVNNHFVCVGVEVKTIGQNIKVNSIKTAFGYRDRHIESAIYTSENIRPEQAALLGEPNSLVYPPALPG